MSQSTSIHFFPTKLPDKDVPSVLQRVLEYLDVDSIDARRLATPEPKWSEIRDGLALNPHFDVLGRRVSPEEAALLCSRGTPVYLSSSSPLISDLTTLVDGFPERVRDHHWPHNLTVICNRHHIYRETEDSLHLFATVPCSVRFWGYNAPHVFEEYQRLVLNLPLIGQIEAHLTEIWGKSDCRIYMRG